MASTEPEDRGREGTDPGERPALATEETQEVADALEQLIEETQRPETQSQPLMLPSDLRGRVAVVTGASSGIGRAIAMELAQAGVHIAFNYLDAGGSTRVAAQRMARQLRELEVRVYQAPCDVRDSRQVNAFVEAAVEELGGVHILVNNAGIGMDHALWRLTDTEWESVLRTNLDGTFHMIRAVTPHLRVQEWGKIVNVASVHALRPEFGLSNYAASKAGVVALTRSAALELGPMNINVNAVAPGYIRTHALAERVPAEILDRAREESALGRLGDPADVANVVLFLCSEAARHITGAVIPVDGGYLI
jgi:3-oxoacyl-[acyl-carrier protein] reductase